MQRICVFCASSAGADPEYAERAWALGGLLAQRKLGLVYGGGNVGLMGAVADGALAAGGEVIGVIPRPLVERELAHTGVTELRVVATMHERKQLMHDLSDGFIAMPGGLGTLEELFETLTWGQLGMHGKPCGLYNVRGYYDRMIAMLDHAVGERLLRVEHRAMLLASADAEELLARMAAYRAPTVPKWLRPGQE